MRACPRKFSFQYIEKAPPDHQPSSLLFGGAIHAAFELYFQTRMEGMQITAGALLSHYHDAWRKEREEAGQDVPVRFNKEETQEKLDDLAGRVIDAFLLSPLAMPQGEILGIEESVRVTLHPDLPDVVARVDLVYQTSDALHVVDFKTSRSRWNEEKAREAGDQLVLYGSTVSNISSSLSLPVQLEFGVVTKAKNPVIQILSVPTDPAKVGMMKETSLQVWEAIKSGIYYPNPTPQNCTTCPFKSKCPVFSGR
jgi:putative RecB family exonuclease